MAKSDLKKIRARARMDKHLAARASAAGAAGPAPPRDGSAGAKAYARRVTGIEWLRNKGKFTAGQAETARTWGRLWRMAAQGDHTVIKSCLAALDGGGGSGAPAFPGQIDYEAAAAARAAVLALGAANSALGNHPGMVAALELICGQEKTPREAVPLATDRELAEVVNALQIALDLLTKHWRENPPPR